MLDLNQGMTSPSIDRYNYPNEDALESSAHRATRGAEPMVRLEEVQLQMVDTRIRNPDLCQ